MDQSKMMRRLLLPGLAVLFASLACNFITGRSPVPTSTSTASLPTPSPLVSLSTPTMLPASPTSMPSQAGPTQAPPTDASSVNSPTPDLNPVNPSPTAVEGTGPRFVNIYLIALEDNGVSGDAIGCGDSLIPVKREIQADVDPLEAALDILLSIDDQYYGESGLYNALYQSELDLERVTVDASGHADVRLVGSYALGGVCDNPRFKAQIEETILQFPQVQSVSVFINGIPLEEILSLQG